MTYELNDLRNWLLAAIGYPDSTQHIPTMALFESALADEVRKKPHRFLAIAKKAAEYSRAPETDKWLYKHNQSLWMALRRLDVGIEWVDREDAGHLNQEITFTDENLWDHI